jgi:polyphosphate kinase 2
MGHNDKRQADSAKPEKLKGKEYLRQLKQLHVELVTLQEWVKHKGLKVCIVFEGRDGAGKGGTIKAITERVSPRVFRVVALPAPTEREKSQMYLQRYVPHFPAGGEVVIFDRSWYNRAGVERVMGFCPEEQVERFLKITPLVEKAMVDSGIVLLKYWLEVSPEEQTRRLEARIQDGRKTWKLSPMDLESYSRWFDYSRARDGMFAATDTPWAPWFVVPTKKLPATRSSCPNGRKPRTIASPSTRSSTFPNFFDRRAPRENYHGRPQHVFETARRTSGRSPDKGRAKAERNSTGIPVAHRTLSDFSTGDGGSAGGGAGAPG